jgi:hypothetical protein
MQQPYKTSAALAGVRYEIRGRLANQAHEMERRGYEIIRLNIGNPGRFGFRGPGACARGDRHPPEGQRGLLPPGRH